MMLDLELVTPPATTPVSLAEMKAHLEVQHEEDNGRIGDAIAEAVGELDGYSGALGRAIVEQTWCLYLDRFPRGRLQLPLPPLISIDEITYVDADGVEKVVDPSIYVVLTGERAELVLAPSAAWPAPRCQARAVAITFKCGWAVPAGEATWPPKVQVIRKMIKLIAAAAYVDRGDGAATVLSPAVARLMPKVRIPRA